MTILFNTAHNHQPSTATVAYSDSALRQDLLRLHVAWRKFQSRRDRDAVYRYLAAVYELVEWWTVDKCANARAAQVLDFCGVETTSNVEPFAAVILCTSSPKKVDTKTRSKWSRALRYAAAVKEPGVSLRRFMRRRGGINECAARYGRLVRNGSQIV